MELERKKFKIMLTQEMLGTVPKDPEIYATYIESKKPENIADEEFPTVEKIEEKGWTGFHKDEKGIFIYDYMIKGFLKNAGNILKNYLKMTAVRSKLTDFAFVFPRKIYLQKSEPDGVLERPLRANGPLGPRVCLAKSDLISSGTFMEFEVGLVPGSPLKMENIETIMEYGQLCGLGQWRNAGFGKFMVVKEPQQATVS